MSLNSVSFHLQGSVTLRRPRELWVVSMIDNHPSPSWAYLETRTHYLPSRHQGTGCYKYVGKWVWHWWSQYMIRTEIMLKDWGFEFKMWNSRIILDIHSTWATSPWLPDYCHLRHGFPCIHPSLHVLKVFHILHSLPFDSKFILNETSQLSHINRDILSTPFKVPYLAETGLT